MSLNENSNKFKSPPVIKDLNVYNHVGSFLLELYHENLFGYDGLIRKNLVIRRFKEYINRNNLRNEPQFQEKVGTLLQQNGFLLHTKVGCTDYKIQNLNFRKFYFGLIQKLDEERIRMSVNQVLPKFKLDDAQKEEHNEYLNLEPNDDENVLEYQTSAEIKIKEDFHLTNTGCVICQKNFGDEEEFDNHIEFHGEASGFESIRNYPKIAEPDFELSYATCKSSHYLRFTVKAIRRRDLVIEKIVIVRSKWMSYARNEDVPFNMPSNGVDYFFVDTHLFNIGAPQPVVILYRLQNQLTYRHFAQFIFVRHNDFPILNMKLKSTRVVSKDEMKRTGKLPTFSPPEELLKLVAKREFSDEELAEQCSLFRQYLNDKKELTPATMCDILKILVQLEDVTISNKYKKLNCKNCEISAYCGEYSMTIKDLKDCNVAEILNPFDEIRLIRKSSENNRGRNCGVVGYVSRVYGSKVCFNLREKGVKLSPTIRYDISFAPGRIPIIYQLKALELLVKNRDLRHFLFPTINFNTSLSKLNLQFYNEMVKINPEQRQAVINIADGPNDAAPYIIFGPPGTGKTTTIVESIYQLWKTNKENKILVTAGSNAACDEVAKKLCEIFSDVDKEGLNLLRIYAAAVEKRIDNMNENLLEASNLCHNFHFYPSIESICSYRIIVATLTVVGKLVHGKMSENFFTHVFIDECAASTEPEALVGLSGILSTKSRLILSGDPKQLGPILNSKKAENLGLGQSLMERLLKRKCYEVDQNTGEYDRTIQTRLIRNFRTNTNILHLSNTLYYHNELVCCAKRDVTDWALGWNRLPSKNFPIIFNVAYGQTRWDKASTSLSNYKELSITMDYVKSLMYFGIKGRKIEEDDIGIISPYKKQYNLIREELDKRRWYKIETGSVETFQGKEKPIIIISMVRSNTAEVGFLDNPRRLNVTLTRAQALMIIIGNPETLKKVDDWASVIEYCQKNNAMAGAKYPREQADFKTSQSSLSTVSNIPRNDNGNNHKNNNNNQKKHRQRRYGRFPNRKQNTKNIHQKENQIPDNISIHSSVMAKWLEDNEKFREQYANYNFDTVSIQSSLSDFEIVKSQSQNDSLPKEKNMYSKEVIGNALDKSIKDIPTPSSQSKKNENIVTRNTPNQQSFQTTTFPIEDKNRIPSALNFSGSATRSTSSYNSTSINMLSSQTGLPSVQRTIIPPLSGTSNIVYTRSQMENPIPSYVQMERLRQINQSLPRQQSPPPPQKSNKKRLCTIS